MAFELRLQFSNWQRRIRFSAMFVVNWHFLFAKPFLWLENIKIIQTHFKLKSERRCFKAIVAKNRAFYRIIGYYCAQCSMLVFSFFLRRAVFNFEQVFYAFIFVLLLSLSVSFAFCQFLNYFSHTFVQIVCVCFFLHMV